jgi:hypothetical protein
MSSYRAIIGLTNIVYNREKNGSTLTYRIQTLTTGKKQNKQKTNKKNNNNNKKNVQEKPYTNLYSKNPLQ